MRNTSEKLIEKTQELMDLTFGSFGAKELKHLDEEQFKMVKLSLELVDITIELQRKYVEHMEKQDEKLDKIIRNQSFIEAKLNRK